jgi:TolB-like protein/Tfp pilus assembly protein PilF
MSETDKNPLVYEFDDVVVDSGNFRILKSGQTKKITPRAFEVLLFLIKRKDQLVSKQELFEAVWKESFVTDNALTRMIKEIRQVIGDNADFPRYIETVSKRGYRFIAEFTSAKSAQNTLQIKNDKNDSSIAVLPFINQSEDPENDYLSEGITENIINNLSKLSSLRVVPRSTVFYFQGRNINPLEVGRKLSVRTVLFGRLLQLGENLIVNAELIDVLNNAQIWGEQYRYKAADIFDLQKQISQEISTQLEAAIGGKEQHQIIEPPTHNAEAYQLYLKGRFFWNRRPSGLMKGIEYFQQALEKDPEFAHAHAGLADSFSTLGSWENGALPPTIAMPKACAEAQKALNLDNRLAEAHTTLAYTKLHYNWDFENAKAGFEHALLLNKNYVHAYHWLSHYYIATGQFEKSLQMSLKAIEIDPLDLIINGHLAWHYWMVSEPDRALLQIEKTRELNPDDIWSCIFAGLALEVKGLYGDAITEFQRALNISPEFSLVQAALGHAMGRNNQLTEARKISEMLINHRSKKFIPAYDVAIAQLAINERDSALTWLKETIAERSGWVAYFDIEPRLGPLRDSPDFGDLLRQRTPQK